MAYIRFCGCKRYVQLAVRAEVGESLNKLVSKFEIESGWGAHSVINSAKE